MAKSEVKGAGKSVKMMSGAGEYLLPVGALAATWSAAVSVPSILGAGVPACVTLVQMGMTIGVGRMPDLDRNHFRSLRIAQSGSRITM